MVEITKVQDDEELYRSIRIDKDEHTYVAGKRIFTYKAFQDRHMEPSVDRAILRDNNAESSKLSSTDGIASLITIEVRTIADVKTEIQENSEKKETQHNVDVKHAPVVEQEIVTNPAHSLVTVSPAFLGSGTKQSKTFKLLKIALAKLATERGWTLEPMTGHHTSMTSTGD